MSDIKTKTLELWRKVPILLHKKKVFHKVRGDKKATAPLVTTKLKPVHSMWAVRGDREGWRVGWKVGDSEHHFYFKLKLRSGLVPAKWALRAT